MFYNLYCKNVANFMLQLQITANRMQRFLNLFIFTDALHVSGVPPPIIRSTKLYIQLQVLSTNTAASCYRGKDGRSISSTVGASSSIGWQYLKLYLQLCTPEDGRRNRLKICRASVKINKFKEHCILLAVICNYITMHGRMNIKVSC
jgi:hypothetical protein